MSRKRTLWVRERVRLDLTQLGKVSEKGGWRGCQAQYHFNKVQTLHRPTFLVRPKSTSSICAFEAETCGSDVIDSGTAKLNPQKARMNKVSLCLKLFAQVRQNIAGRKISLIKYIYLINCDYTSMQTTGLLWTKRKKLF
jgi:hypothetical protein